MLLVVVLFASSVLSLPLAPENDFLLERRGNEGFIKRSAQSADYDEYDGQDQIAVASSSAGGQVETRVPSEGFDLSKFLGAAEAQPLRAEGHEVQAGGRRKSSGYGKRSAQTSELINQNQDIEPQTAASSAHPASSKVSASVIASILAAAGAKPQPIDEASRSYAGKRSADIEYGYGKRSAQVTEEQASVVDTQAATEPHPASSKVSASVIASILAAAGAKPQPIDEASRSYAGKRSADAGFGYGKRSAQVTDEPIQTTEAENQEAAAHPAASKVSLSEIAKILAAAGAKPQPIVEGDRSYAGKRSVHEEFGYGKRDADEADPGVVASIPLAAVKVKPHGSQGNIAQHFDGDASYQNNVHVSRFGRARRSNNFIPFHVYDDRRVKTLKVEQNDFLALNTKSEGKQLQIKKNHA